MRLTPEPGEAMKNNHLSARLSLFKNGDVFFLLFIFLTFLFLLREAQHYPQESRNFPELIIWCTLLLSGSLLIIYFFIPSWKDAVVSPDAANEEKASTESEGRFFRGWICIAISLVAAFLFGFLFLIPAAFISYTAFLGQKGVFVKILFIALATAVVIYVVFDYFLGIPTLHGFFWNR